MIRIFITFVILTTLFSCTYTPQKRDGSTELPLSYGIEIQEKTVQMVTQPDREWWAQFKMAELNKLIEELDDGSYDLAIARQRVLRARALWGQQNSRNKPVLNGRFTGDHVETRGSGSSEEGKLAFIAAYEVDLWGQRSAANHAAALGVVLEEAKLKSMALTLQAQVAQQYFSLLAIEDRVKTTERNLQVTKELFKLVQIRFDAGRASGIELDQQRTIQLNQQSQLLTQKRDLEIAKRALAVLLGRDGLLEIETKAHLQDATVPIVAIVQPAALLQSRPDIRVAEAELQISDTRVFQTKKRRWPSLSLSAEASLGDIFSSNIDWTTSLLGQLIGPIFNAGRITKEIKASEADASAALLNYRRTVIQAVQETLNSLTDLEHRRELHNVRKSELETNERLYDLALVRFKAGTIDFITVLDVQRNLFTATERFINAKRDYLAAIINIYRAMGVSPQSNSELTL